MRWARERAQLGVDALENKFPYLSEWESEQKKPTIKQLEAYAKATRTPVGYLFLTEPPEEQVLDETKQLLCIEKADLGIDVFATTREALLTELQEQISMLWQEYAQAPDDELDAPARVLKHALLARFGEVTNAA